ncbi:MAG: hypothetical protein M3Y17_09630 [Actinomycetota bacterium]|nr:hypothetical protein [Actinomycetota bacterium]
MTHVMPELENELDDALELVRRAYPRELVVAEDLMRVVVWDIPVWNRLWRNGAGMPGRDPR